MEILIFFVIIIVLPLIFPTPATEGERLNKVLSVFPIEYRNLGLIELLRKTFGEDEESINKWCYLYEKDYMAAAIALKSYVLTNSLTDSIKQEHFEGMLYFNNDEMKTKVEGLLSEFESKKTFDK